jgi:hypothetical protein
MSANQSFNPASGAANGSAAVTGKIPPGLTLLAFRDASRLAFRDKARDPANSTTPKLTAEKIHAGFTALVALASIALLAFAH